MTSYFCAPGAHEIQGMPILVVERRFPLVITWMCEKHLYVELAAMAEPFAVVRQKILRTSTKPVAKVPDAKIVEAYRVLGTEGRVARSLGISRWSVHRRLVALGFETLPRNGDGLLKCVLAKETPR